MTPKGVILINRRCSSTWVWGPFITRGPWDPTLDVGITFYHSLTSCLRHPPHSQSLAAKSWGLSLVLCCCVCTSCLMTLCTLVESSHVCGAPSCAYAVPLCVPFVCTHHVTVCAQHAAVHACHSIMHMPHAAMHMLYATQIYSGAGAFLVGWP